MHAHTCLSCGKVLAVGEFDCEYDRDHDFADCESCAVDDVDEVGAERNDP